jgi:hypothetical protein
VNALPGYQLSQIGFLADSDDSLLAGRDCAANSPATSFPAASVSATTPAVVSAPGSMPQQLADLQRQVEELQRQSAGK